MTLSRIILQAGSPDGFDGAPVAEREGIVKSHSTPLLVAVPDSPDLSSPIVTFFLMLLSAQDSGLVVGEIDEGGKVIPGCYHLLFLASPMPAVAYQILVRCQNVWGYRPLPRHTLSASALDKALHSSTTD